METQTALVRTDSGIILYSEATVNLNLTVVIYPRNSENDLSLWLNKSVDNACLYEPLLLPG